MRAVQPTNNTNPKQALAALAIMAAACLILFWPIVSGRYSFYGDYASMAYPWASFVAKSFIDGRLPLWDNLRAAGYPFQACSQAQIFYPISLALPLLTEGGRLSYYGLEIITLLHFVAGGFFAYLLGRRLGFNFSAALITGLSFMSCGFLWAHNDHKSAVETVAWLPLVILSVDRIIRQPDFKSIVLAAAAGAMLVLVGWTPLLFIAAPFVLALAVLGIIWDARGLSPRLRITGALLLSACMVIGLSAVQTIPSLEMAALSSRQQPDYIWASKASLWPGYLLSALIPLIHYQSTAYSMDELHFFTGLAPLMLAGLGTAASANPRRFFWLISAAAAIIVALGPHTPVYPWLWHNLWGMNMFRCPGRYMLVFDLAVAILAGMGAVRLMDKDQPAGKALWAVLGFYFLLGCWGAAVRIQLALGPPGLADVWGLAPDLAGQLDHALLVWFAALGLMVMARLSGLAGRLGLPGLLVLLVAAAWAFPSELAWREKSPDEHYPVTSNVRYLQKRVPPGRVGIDKKLTFNDRDETNASLVFNLPSGSIYETLDLMRRYKLTRLGDPRIYTDLIDERFLSSPHPPAKLHQGKFHKMEWQLRGRSRETLDLSGLMSEQLREVGIVSHLAHGEKAGQGDLVAELVLSRQGREVARLPIRAGIETAEWSIDNPDKRSEFIHRRAQVARSWDIVGGKFKGHSFAARWLLPEPAQVDEIMLCGAGNQHIKTVIRAISLNGRDLSQYGRRYEQVGPNLYRNQYAMDRFRFLRKWRISRPGPAALQLTRMVDLKQECVLEKEPALKRRAKTAGHPGADKVELVSEQPGRLVLKARTSAPGILFAADTYYPGWRVMVDGRPAELLRCNYLFRGVALEPGQHLVEFLFQPASFRLGALISLASLAGLAALGGIALFARRRRKRYAPGVKPALN